MTLSEDLTDGIMLSFKSVNQNDGNLIEYHSVLSDIILDLPNAQSTAPQNTNGVTNITSAFATASYQNYDSSTDDITYQRFLIWKSSEANKIYIGYRVGTFVTVSVTGYRL